MNFKENDIVIINPESLAPESFQQYTSSCITAKRFGWNDYMTEAQEEGNLGVVVDVYATTHGIIIIATFDDKENRSHTFDPSDLIKIGEL